MPFSMWPGMWQSSDKLLVAGHVVVHARLLPRAQEHPQPAGARRHAGRRRRGQQVRRRGRGIGEVPGPLHVVVADDEVVDLESGVEDR